MNKCFFTGRTTKDIELRYTSQSQTAVGNFSLAVTEGYGDQKKTDFFNMTVWGKLAESMERYVKKGTKIVVECKAVPNQYTDKNGNKVNTVVFDVKSFEFCESKSGGNTGTPATPETPTPSSYDNAIPAGFSYNDEDVPF